MRTRIRHTLIFGISFLALSAQTEQRQKTKMLSKNGMRVKWHYENHKIFFEMKAPTNGWVTIGFNTSENLTGAYLLMGRIINKKAEIVEHYTSSPGNYSPIASLGGEIKVSEVEGQQKNGETFLQFSLPVLAKDTYRKNLSQGKEYVMILAYSQEDDFQHHSIMRTSIQVEL